MRHQMKVADVMTADVVTVTMDTSFKDVAELLAERRITAVPVVDGVGEVVGVVSESDLLRKEGFEPSRQAPWRIRRRRGERAKAAAVDAGQLMTHPAVTIGGDATISEAARSMAALGVTRLVVTDGGALAGIVTRSDLLKVFIVPDEEIAARIRHDVVEHGLWADPAAIGATVVNGVVTLTGELENRSMVATAEQLTRETDGVVDVKNQLTWAFDDTLPDRGNTRYPIVPRQP